MIILACYKSTLAATSAVNTIVSGRIYIGRVDQDALRPNILMEMPESGQEYTHSGPSGLFEAHVKITARADTDQAAFTLGEAIARALQNWTGTALNCKVQMTEHFNSMGGYDDAAKVFTQVEEFTSFFTRTA